MAPRPMDEVSHAVGSLEARVDILIGTVERQNDNMDRILSRLLLVEPQAAQVPGLAVTVGGLNKTFNDAKIQGRAFFLGVAFAGGMAATGLGFAVKWVGQQIGL